jgi:membrane protein required for colicin V production
MTWVDLVVLGFIALSGLLAFGRGLVREVMGIGAWVGAVAAAIYALPHARGFVSRYVHAPEWVDPIALAIVFVVALVALMIVAHVIGEGVRRSALGGVDRTLGLVFGLVRGAVIVCVAYIIGNMVFPIQRWPHPVLEARTLGPAYQGAAWLRDQLPEPVRPHRLEPPPSGPDTTAEALFHATPQGRATGKPGDHE